MNKLTAPPKRYLRYERLANQLREQVASGKLKPGDQLPSFSQMQAEHGVGQAILERVYTILEGENLIVRRPKQGIFVAEPRRRETLNVIGVSLGLSPGRHPYYSLLLEGIHEVAQREGVEILLLHVNSTIGLEKMDGLILMTGLPNSLSLLLPAVTLIRPIAGVPCLQADEYGGMRAAVQHLLDLGHRKIAYLHPIRDYPGDPLVPGIDKLRIAAYRDALKEAGIKPQRRWARPIREAWESVNWETCSFTEVGYRAMSRWLDEDWEQGGCTAILAHNDDAAIGIMRAFRERGIRVPEDVSVVGYDGTDVCTQVTPTLTSVTVPLRELGSRGLEVLLEKIDAAQSVGEPAGKPLEEVIPTRLEVRESTAPPGK